MKKLLVFIGAMFICAFAIAQTISVDWKVDGNIYAQNTCEYGGTLTVPSTPPTKYGYTFRGWGDYLKLEYIESTGTQYIDTGYTLQSTHVKIQLQFMINSNSFNGALFGVSSTVSDKEWFTLYFSPGSMRAYWAIGNKNVFYKNYSKGILYDTQIETFADFTYVAKLNQEQESGSWSGTFIGQAPGKIYLYTMSFLPNSSSWLFSGNVRLYNAKIYDNNTLVRDFIPAKRLSDNEVGMYDTVTGTFFTNAGTGEFIAGPVVGDL